LLRGGERFIGPFHGRVHASGHASHHVLPTESSGRAFTGDVAGVRSGRGSCARADRRRRTCEPATRGARRRTCFDWHGARAAFVGSRIRRPSRTSTRTSRQCDAYDEFERWAPGELDERALSAADPTTASSRVGPCVGGGAETYGQSLPPSVRAIKGLTRCTLRRPARRLTRRAADSFWGHVGLLPGHRTGCCAGVDAIEHVAWHNKPGVRRAGRSGSPRDVRESPAGDRDVNWDSRLDVCDALGLDGGQAHRECPATRRGSSHTT